MKNLCLRFFFKIITSSLLMLVIIARFKAEQICRKRRFKIVSSGESLFSVIKHSLCSMQGPVVRKVDKSWTIIMLIHVHYILVIYCSEF